MVAEENKEGNKNKGWSLQKGGGDEEIDEVPGVENGGKKEISGEYDKSC
jgi:hypothetical protein